MLEIGPLRLDEAEFGSQGSAVLGIRDSGKTYTATLIAERLFDAGIPFVAFDPIGVWRFLRVPGKGKGYPVVVAGGEEADLPLTPGHAPAIVEAAMQNGVSLVIDLFDMRLSKADWKRIVRDCVTLLLHRNKQYGLRHIFLEEAAEFAPQKVGRGDGEVYAVVEKLARMGGNSRLGYTLINQRSQEVNKAVLELCDNLFLHRQKGLNALSNLKKWLDVAGANNELMSTLPTLPQGECWAWIAGSDVPVHMKVPEKNSLHPDRRVTRDDAALTEAAREAVNVDSFVAALKSQLVEVEAEAKANDPAELRREIVRLKRELAKAEQGSAPAWPDQREEVAALRAELTETAAALAGLTASAKELQARQNKALAALSGDRVAVPDVPAPKPVPRQQAPRVAPAAPAPRQLNGGRAVHDGPTGPQRQLLGAIAWWSAMGHEHPTRAQVAAIAGWKITSGHLKNVAGSLRTLGLIDYPAPGRFALTDEGRAVAPDPDQSLSFHDQLRSTLSGPQRLVFDHLLGTGEQSREEMALAVGWEPTSGHVKNILGSMRTLEVVDYPAPGYVSLAEWARQGA